MNLLEKTAAKFISEYFSEQKGFLLKIGQYLGSANEASSDFRRLITSGAQVRPWSDVKKSLETIYPNLDNIFCWIDNQGIAASLSQVHRAQLKTGELVAIKIQHEGIGLQIEKWMKRLNLLPAVGPIKKWQIPWNDFVTEFNFSLQRELNFKREVLTLNSLQQTLGAYPQFMSPLPFSALSNTKCIVMSWLEGKPLLELSAEESAIAGTLLTEIFLRQILQFEQLQADFNPGNFKYHDGKLALLDAGSIFDLPHPICLGLGALLLSNTINFSPDDFFQIFVLLEFDPEKISHIKEKLPYIARILLEPFNEDLNFKISDWKPSEKILSLLQEDKWWFRSAGSTTFFHVLRSFALLLRTLHILNLKANFKTILDKVLVDIPGLKAEVINKVKNHSRPQIHSKPMYLLNVEIKDRHNAQIVQLKMPIAGIDDLENLIPDTTLLEIKKQGIEIQQLIKDFKSKNLCTGEVARLETDQRKIFIRIE